MKLIEKPEIISDLYLNQKLTRKELAERYNTSISSVDRFLQKHNILRDRTTKNLSEVEDQVKEYINKNYTNDFICKQLNIPLSQLKNIKEKENIVINYLMNLGLILIILFFGIYWESFLPMDILENIMR